MKRVALINPKGNIFGKNEKLVGFLNDYSAMESFKVLWSGPNLGLLTLASQFPEDWECVYLDENRRDIDYSQDYDIVFISSMTQQIVRAYEIIEIYKERGVLTVIGGIHVSTMPEEATKYADAVLVGEAESVWDDFYSDYMAGKLKPIYKSKLSFDLANARIPRYDLIMNYDYPLVSIQTTRGCPHSCSFCAASRVFGSKYRRKSNSQILKEFKYVNDLFPGKLVLFADDNAFMNIKDSLIILEELIKLDIRFIAQVDISIAKNDQLLRKMSEAGCQWVVIGFESINADSLYNLDENNWKYKQVKTYEESIKKIQQYGIGVYGTFIVGLDHDDHSIFHNTAQFIINNNMYGANITIPTPLPGTKLREKMLEDNRILDLGWDYYTLWDAVIVFPNFTKDEVEAGVYDLYQEINKSEYTKKRLIHLKHLVDNKRKLLKNPEGGIHDFTEQIIDENICT